MRRGVTEEAGPERECHRRRAHRRAGMARVGLLDAVDRERPDRVDGEAVERRAGERHGPRSIGLATLTTPPPDAPRACRRTGRPGPRRGSHVAAGAPLADGRVRLEGRRLGGQGIGDALGREGPDRGDVLVPCREVLRPEAVRDDPQPEMGHVQRRIAGMRRDHERQADGRLAQQPAVGVDVQLAERPHPEPSTEVDGRVRPAGRDDLPARATSPGDPGAEAVDDERERVPGRLGPAVRDDTPCPRPRRLRQERPEPRVDPRLERDLLGERRAPRGRDSPRGASCSRPRSSARRPGTSRRPAPTAPTRRRSPARSPGRDRRTGVRAAPYVEACQRTRRIASSAVVQNVARKTSSGATASSVSTPRGAATTTRSGVRSSAALARVNPSSAATAASGTGVNETIRCRGNRDASSSNRSRAVRVPPKTRPVLSVGISRLSRGPVSPAGARLGLTSWSSATPSMPSGGAAARFLPAPASGGTPRIASRRPRDRAVSRPERRTADRIEGTRAVYRPGTSRSHPFLRAVPPAYAARMARGVARRRHRAPKVAVIGDLMLDVVVIPSRPLERGTDVPGRVALRQGGSAANTARWLARLGARSTLVTAVGRDPAGRALVEAVACATA